LKGNDLKKARLSRSAQPNVKILGIVLSQAVFELKGSIAQGQLDGAYQSNFEYGISYPKPGFLENKLTVTCINKKQPDCVDIRVTVLGRFQCDDERELKQFALNAAPMLVPYARTYIATITGWGPMNSLLLPPMNLTQAGCKRMAKKKAVRPARLVEPSKKLK
jgi:preprotein translocase subunit SecB